MYSTLNTKSQLLRRAAYRADVTLRRTMAACAAGAFLAALAFLPGQALIGGRTAADEPQYLLTAISLFEDRDLDLADELSAARWRDFHADELPRQTQPTPEGREISPHDPGLPVLLALPVGLGGWAGAKVLLALVNGALAAVLVWTAVRRFAVATHIAAPVVLALTIGPPVAVYGAQVYPELPGALCIAGIVALAGAERRRGAAVAGIVALATIAAWLSVKYVPVAGSAAAIALWTAHRAGARQAVAWALGSAAALGALYALAHVRWYGGLTAYASGDFFAEHGGQLSVMGDRPEPARAHPAPARPARRSRLRARCLATALAGRRAGDRCAGRLAALRGGRCSACRSPPAGRWRPGSP